MVTIESVTTRSSPELLESSRALFRSYGEPFAPSVDQRFFALADWKTRLQTCLQRTQKAEGKCFSQCMALLRLAALHIGQWDLLILPAVRSSGSSSAPLTVATVSGNSCS